jgi:hypothetical protein
MARILAVVSPLEAAHHVATDAPIARAPTARSSPPVRNVVHRPIIDGEEARVNGGVTRVEETLHD